MLLTWFLSWLPGNSMQSFVICLIYRCQYSSDNWERCYFIERLRVSLAVEHTYVSSWLRRIWGCTWFSCWARALTFSSLRRVLQEQLALFNLFKETGWWRGWGTLSRVLPIMACICPLQFVHVPNLSCNVSGLRWMTSFFGLCTDKWSKTTGEQGEKNTTFTIKQKINMLVRSGELH